MGLGVGMSGLDSFFLVKTIASVTMIAINIRMMITNVMISRRLVELSNKKKNVRKILNAQWHSSHTVL